MIWNFLKGVMKVNNKQAGNEFEREFCDSMRTEHTQEEKYSILIANTMLNVQRE